MPFRTNFSGISGTLLVRTLQTYSRHPRWCKGTAEVRVVTAAVPLATVLRSPGDSSAAATLQLVALLRHPDGVDELAGGEIEQISLGAGAECSVGRPVHVRRMRVAGRDRGEPLALRGVDKEARIRFIHRAVEGARDLPPPAAPPLR